MTMATAPSPAPVFDGAPTRLDFLDWVRVGAFGLLIFYHIGMFYVSWDWHAKSDHASPWAEPLMMLSSPWRLTLLFLVSGIATRFMADRLLPGKLARSRLTRLGIPLLFGMAVVVPPQSYVEVVEKIAYPGSYWQFWGQYLTFYQGFCRDGDCLILPTWNHLWFVAYLLVYTLILDAILIINRDWSRLNPFLRWTEGALLLFLPWLVLAGLRLGLAPIFPITHALVDDWYNHALSFSAFLFGFVLARRTGVWENAQQLRWPALALGLAAYAGLQLYYATYADRDPPETLRAAMRCVYAAQQWGFILAILGFARRHLDRRPPILPYLSRGVFPFYILHQTVIVCAGHGLKKLGLPAGWEFAALVAVTLATCLGCYEIIRRVPLLRPLFGLPYAKG
ncbi:MULTISPECIES: acyltransferase family protein [unclassified Azospirillum]|uniref:acyltransferase family protein n=1 Tax=unclassified Azospirillum TaxID=2630922 RepID=UPI00190EFC73|nr:MULTISPECIES: acyltransferase family protein [unclassified Azospirillum]